MEFLKRYQESFEHFLKDQLNEGQPPSLYDPIHYILDTSGKRIRPVLVLMAEHIFSGEFYRSLPAAYAVEIFHNFTLLHDDIMDNAEKRRGFPSVHMKFGVPNAILSGDVMMIYAIQYLLSLNNKTLAHEASHYFSQIAIEICEGQQLDMDYEHSDHITIDDYIGMITKKTSILLGAALKLGAMIGEAGKNDQEHVFEFGKNIGIAFQIQDDILDVFGEMDKTGKIHAGDIINNKKTYLYLKSLELSTPDQKEKLLTYFNSKDMMPEEKIHYVKSLYTELAVKEYANLLKEAYLHLGISHLKSISVRNEVITHLEELAHFMISRDY